MPVTRSRKATTSPTNIEDTTMTETSATSIAATSNAATTERTTTFSAAPTSVADVPRLSPPASSAEQSIVNAARTVSLLRRTEAPMEPETDLPSQQKDSAKARKIANAKIDILRVELELAKARLALLEGDEIEEELENHGSSARSRIEVRDQADDWLASKEPQPQTAMPKAPEEAPVTNEEGHTSRPGHYQMIPAGAQMGLVELTTAITHAVQAGQRQKYIELPSFEGSHQEWLAFRSAYYETANMLSPAENINRLRKNLTGKAKEAVNGLLIMNTSPDDVMRALESRFGRPEAIAMMEMETLRSLPRLTESPQDICTFSAKISNTVATLKMLKCTNYMVNPEMTKTVVDKFTSILRYRYYDFAALQPEEEPDLVKIEKFLRNESEICSKFVPPERPTIRAPATQYRRSQRINNVAEQYNTPKQPICSICKKEHFTSKCEEWRSLDVNGRWEIAKSENLCFRCLRPRNKVHKCRSKVCGIDNCKMFHHQTLHNQRDKKIEKREDTEESEVINSAWTHRRKQSYLKIIPVQVKGPKGTMNTYALMDDGSTVTLIDDSVAQHIGAIGPVDPLNIETINAMKTTESASRRVKITLKGLNKRKEKIYARTVSNLQVSSQRVTKEMLDECKHLTNIRKYLTYTDVKPRILIGQDNWHLLLTSEVRKGGKNQLVASLTPLGWVLHGNRTRTNGRSVDFINHLKEEPEDLDGLVKRYFEIDALCLQPKKPKTDPEQQALMILEETTTKTQTGRYETGLLWRKGEVTFPNNYENSLKRLYNIEKKLDRDPNLKLKYMEQMDALVAKGYAEPAPKEKIEDKTWYLPHFAVVNPMKPEKLRVVHDAAAKTKGVALNDMLLKGPDLLQSLPGVVMRFRQHRIAVTADIKEMFMQVKLRTEDRDALRYLWRRDRRDGKPDEYRMTSLIFGASSSPATAIYIKNLNAEQHKNTHPEAAAAIVKKHYVDDYLDSFESIEDAVRVAQGVKEIHAKAGFELRQWRSNSRAVLTALGETRPAENIELWESAEITERVLGVIWDLNSDEFAFNLNIARIAPKYTSGKAPTKREALRTVMSLFDPLGFASPVTIKAKQLLQEVWRRGTSWDEELDDDLAEQWQEWMTHLQHLSNLKIPRSYTNYSEATSLQLHIFTDASEVAYSAVVYWRTVAPTGETSLSLVVAKAKVAPLKLTSIPRLELQAAVMGTRLAATVIEEHERKPDRQVFWTDSKTVLAWIRAGSRTYKPYVAHRLAAIEECTKVSDWRWVPTKLNVADDATRDVPTEFNTDHRWYQGPEFLRETEEYWPTEVTTTEKEQPSGEERVHYIGNKSKPKLSEALPDTTRFSSWDRLRYATSRVLQFVDICKANREKINYKRTMKNAESDPEYKKNMKQPLTYKAKKLTSPGNRFLHVSAEYLIQAEKLLMRSSQEESFAQEISKLKNGEILHKESRLYQLSVEYVNNAIKLRSRIQATQCVANSVKSPIVLDGNNHTVKLWVKHIHRRLHHAGVEATINECRQHYWVLRVRPVTRAIIRSCLFCRMKTQTPPYPRTGDLPSCRLAHHKRPFTFTGVDYFGPLTVTVGRTRQKRYVAVFTCLTVRAIHLEIAASLTTDSAVMALRRMMARRGCPAEIWSDNGTNLKGADKELRKAIDDATAEEAAKKTIPWRYIPPGAPFMGGAWERMVRSVKTALAATLHERSPSEEVLSTLLAEVEYTVNSRPLTHVSVSPEDPEALTPNHFLLGGARHVPQPGTFDEKDEISRSTWRAAQRLADIFWARWVKEYLPELQHRREPHGRGSTIKVDDLVQIIDANSPRNIWMRGRVIATYPGPDGVVRTVDVKTKGGVLRRPVRKLVVLLAVNDVPAPKENSTTSNGGSDVRDSV